ncbi:MAG: response regulator [Actinomycetota bacterium]|nr:response regulator [Actinomycetota bacterium]
MKVLVADDSPLLRAAVGKLLVEAGYEVVPAEDGIEAIQHFYSDQPDLVLLDIQMPKMNGYVVCRLIKEDWSAAHVPVLILTVRDSAEDRYWAQRSGADGYLTKDSLGEELLSSIQGALAGRALSELLGDGSPRRSLEESDVLSRVCDLLDRQLFEATIVNDIITMGSRTFDVHTTVEQTLVILRRFVEYDLAGILLDTERRFAYRCDRTVGRADFEEFRSLARQEWRQLAGGDLLDEDEVVVWCLGGAEVLEDGEGGGWPSFFSMPLRSRGEVLAMLVIGARRAGAYGDKVTRTLRLIESPIATVLESAQHYQRLLEQEARLSLSALSQD